MRIFVVLLFFSTACATSYGPKGFTGGYENTQVGTNKHMITVECNGYTSTHTCYSYWHRRANELCSLGYMPVGLQSLGSTGFFMSGNVAVPVNKPGISGYAICK